MSIHPLCAPTSTVFILSFSRQSQFHLVFSTQNVIVSILNLGFFIKVKKEIEIKCLQINQKNIECIAVDMSSVQTTPISQEPSTSSSAQTATTTTHEETKNAIEHFNFKIYRISYCFTPQLLEQNKIKNMFEIYRLNALFIALRQSVVDFID